MVYVDKDGVAKASKPIGAAMVDRNKLGVLPGKVMHVAAGPHAGLRCEVQALEPRQEGRSERARVRLLPSHEVVSVHCVDLAEEGRGDKRGGSGGGGKRRRGSSPKPNREAPPAKEEKPWLAPNIR